MEDGLKKNGRQPQKKWKKNQSTKINLIGFYGTVNNIEGNQTPYLIIFHTGFFKF
jgi:hypothetical protein